MSNNDNRCPCGLTTKAACDASPSWQCGTWTEADVRLKQTQTTIADKMAARLLADLKAGRPRMADVLNEIRREVIDAECAWPPMNSAHEAYAVLAEEVDELWDHVKVNQKRRDIPAMRKEAVQVAAMAIRFIRDICDGGNGGK